MQALAKLIRGPGNWIVPEDANVLSRVFHFPVGIKDFKITACAAKCLVFLREARSRGGLHIRTKFQELSLAKECPHYPLRPPWITHWLNNCFASSLWRNITLLDSNCIPEEKKTLPPSNNYPRPWPEHIEHKIKHHFQATTVKALLPPSLIMTLDIVINSWFGISPCYWPCRPESSSCFFQISQMCFPRVFVLLFFVLGGMVGLQCVGLVAIEASNHVVLGVALVMMGVPLNSIPFVLLLLDGEKLH